MAKLKPAGKKKKKNAVEGADLAKAVPCLVVVLTGLLLFGALFYYSLSGAK